MICENSLQEINNVKCYFDKLKDYNLKLKAKQQEVLLPLLLLLPLVCQFSSLFLFVFIPFFSCVFLVLVMFMLLYLYFLMVGPLLYLDLLVIELLFFFLQLSHDPRQGVVVHKQPQFPGVAHHPPLILNQSACGVATTSSGVPSSSSNDVGPIGIPDLNLPLEESMTVEFCEPLDMSVNVANRNLSRAMAAQARQNRLHIYRFKNSIGISKPRYSCR